MTHPLDVLAPATYVNLETFKRDGAGVKTPVWAARSGDALYIFTDGTSFKVKRLGRNSKARIAACNVNGQVILSPWFKAEAVVLPKGEEEDRAYEVLRAKYGLQLRILDFFSKLGGRYARRKVIAVRFPAA